MKTQLSLIAVLVAAALPSFADQCAIIPLAQANLAKAIIEGQGPSRAGNRDYNDPTVIVSFCDSCQNDKPTPFQVGSVQVVTSFSVKDGGGAMPAGMAQVNVIDSTGKTQQLDLAYAFLQVGNSETPVRLAPLVGCAYHQGTAQDTLPQ